MNYLSNPITPEFRGAFLILDFQIRDVQPVLGGDKIETQHFEVLKFFPMDYFIF